MNYMSCLTPLYALRVVLYRVGFLSGSTRGLCFARCVLLAAYIAIRVHQDGDDVISCAPGALALPQQVGGGAVGHARLTSPHLEHTARQHTESTTEKKAKIHSKMCVLFYFY